MHTHYGGHFLVFAAAVLAASVIVAASAWSHYRSSGRIYGALVTAHNPVNNALAGASAADCEVYLAKAHEAAREGARWSNTVRCEATAWVIVILVFMFLVAGYKFWLRRL